MATRTSTTPLALVAALLACTSRPPDTRQVALPPSAAPATPAPPAAAPPDWSAVPLTDVFGAEPLGAEAERQAVGRALAEGASAKACLGEWHVRPPKLEAVEAELELRLLGHPGAWVVEDALVTRATVEDAGLTACLARTWRGLAVERPAARDGARVRLRWPVTLSLRAD